MKKYLFLLILFVLFFPNTVLGCVTGFACSIDNLEQLQQDSLIQYIDNLFNKEINVNYFFAHPFYSENYNDLFLFKSVL
jgi:hypothetical protein